MILNIDFLKQDFLEDAKSVFGSDYEAFLETYNEKPYRGISVNTLKITAERLKELLVYKLEKTPMYKNGYYIDSEIEGLGNNPLHHAGAFYVQEPSASAPVSLLDVQEGERILDLCSAPGGKSSQILALLNNTGLLWSNEYVKSRSQILLSNLERMGARNFVVSNCSADTLCDGLEGFFDKILVDAPCSGEGMFRKNHDASDEWSRDNVKLCAERQLFILESASKALRAGGMLVYSTCTFSYEENEGVVSEFLKRNDDFAIDEIEYSFGRKSNLKGCVRISPLEGGEGQFMVRLRKSGNEPACDGDYKFNNNENKLVSGFIDEVFSIKPSGNIEIIGDRAYIFPENLPKLNGLGVIRAGVFLGEIKKNRIEPAHALFSAYTKEYFKNVLNLKLNDERVEKFLSGEEIDCENQKGYTLLAVEGVSLGFGKCSNGRMKNKYPKGLRRV